LAAPERLAEATGLWGTQRQHEGAVDTVLERYPRALVRVGWRDPHAPAADLAWRWEGLEDGAGNATSGQVLVLHDLAGINAGRMAKFVKQYGDARGAILESVEAYAREVRERVFPGADHVYSVDPTELDEFRRRLEEGDLDSSYSWDWEPLG
jgi:3-methyl-2-oxobutanoate hydroxymethyltransferase